jgi:hypothetical protein
VLVASPWAEKVNAGVGGVILVGKGKRTVANVFTKTRQWGKQRNTMRILKWHVTFAPDRQLGLHFCTAILKVI